MTKIESGAHAVAVIFGTVARVAALTPGEQIVATWTGAAAVSGFAGWLAGLGNEIIETFIEIKRVSIPTRMYTISHQELIE